MSFDEKIILIMKYFRCKISSSIGYIFACLDSKWDLETTIGLTIGKKEDAYVESKKNAQKYVQLVLGLDKLPDMVNQDIFFLDYNENNYISLELDTRNGISISDYFNDLRKKIATKYYHELDSAIVGLSVSYEEIIEFDPKEYMCCKYCGGVLKILNYSSHLKNKHNTTLLKDNLPELNDSTLDDKIKIYEKMIEYSKKRLPI